MVVFCEKCKNLMLPKGEVLVCTTCGAEKAIKDEEEHKLVRQNREREKQKRLLLVEDNIQTLPTTRAECPSCGNTLAEWWLLQTRKADEGETRFFRCTKCRYTWREYQ